MKTASPQKRLKNCTPFFASDMAGGVQSHNTKKAPDKVAGGSLGGGGLASAAD
jgi:hypothetical protein